MSGGRFDSMRSLVVPANEESLDEVLEFIGGELERHGCSVSPLVQTQLDMAVEEIFVNISSYAYKPAKGDVEIRCEVRGEVPSVTVQLLDRGRPFDPLAKEDADTCPEALEAREGGLGILLVKKTMDHVSYSYENGKNVLTFTKKL